MDEVENELGYDAATYRKFMIYAWRYLLVFSLLYCCLYCMRLNLANASAALMPELGITTSDIGILTGSLFWGYSIGQLVNGRLSEMIGARKFIIAAVLMSVTMNLLMCLSVPVFALGLIWGFNGFFQAMAWTPGIALLTNWWPSRRRGFAVGYAVAFSGFGQVAATLSVAATFFLFPALGAKGAFLVPALLPFLCLIAFLVLTRPSPQSIGIPEYREADRESAKQELEMRAILKEKGALYPYRFIFGRPKFFRWIFVSFGLGLSRYGLVTWVPLYFIDKFGASVVSGLIQSVALPVGMGIGTLLVPTLTDRYCPKNRILGVIFSCAAACLTLIALSVLEPNGPLQIVLIQTMLFFSGFFVYAAIGTAWTYAADIGGRVFTATTLGVLDFSQYIGAATQSVFFGFILERMGWTPVFLTISLMCAVIALVGLTMRRIEN